MKSCLALIGAMVSVAGCASKSEKKQFGVAMATGRRLKTAALLVLFGLIGAGCATIVKGTDQSVSLDTPGYPGASCTLTSDRIGTRVVTTPAVLNLNKSKHDVIVRCKKGCATGQGVIVSNTEEMAAGNVILGGVIGLGVDAASGAMNEYSRNNQVHMTEDPGCKAGQ